ncbi:hypothetical protein HA402_008151 [Bradysia odoriphaga]|nr:hypothetical protein HA402_008151 [Bradysia odoriphaga]
MMPPQKKFTDDDGFAFIFEAKTPAKERKFYCQSYNEIVAKLSDFQRCVNCDMYISINRIQMHPLLHVTLCASCHRNYTSIDFNKSSNSTLCRWCGKGGIRYTRRSCFECGYQFCSKCILRAVTVGEEIGDNWKCFCCAPEAIYDLKAQHWALVNYEAKRKSLNDDK